jgi:hypothetical protein
MVVKINFFHFIISNDKRLGAKELIKWSVLVTLFACLGYFF